MKRQTFAQPLVLLPLWVVLALTTGSLAAEEEDDQDPLIEEFFITETVYPQDQGEVQLTAFPGYFSGTEDGDEYIFGVAAEYGVTDRFQVEAAWVAYRSIDFGGGDRESGIGDLEIGVKYAFDKDEVRGLQLAVGFDVTFPVGDEDKGLSEGNRVYEPFLILSQDLGDDANLHFNLSYGIVDVVHRGDEQDAEDDEDGEEEEADDEGKPGADELEVNLGLVARLSDDWRGTLELNLETNEIDDGKETELFLTPGLKWKGTDDMELGIGVPVGLTDDSADWGILAQALIEF